MQPTEIVLVATVIFFMVADIILCLMIRIALPNHITLKEYYPADGRRLKFKKAALVCPCLHAVYPNGTDSKIKFTTIPKNDTVMTKRSTEDISKAFLQFPYILSLSHGALPPRFACNGFIQNREWLLTTKACVQGNSDWYNLTVRSESPFWSVGGKEHEVIDYNDDDDPLVYVRVSPSFSPTLVPVPPLAFAPAGTWKRAFLLGWDDVLLKTNSANYISKAFDVEKWYPFVGNGLLVGDSQVCYKFPNCEVSSQILITSDHRLIAVKSAGNKKCQGFLSLTSDQKKIGNCYPLFSVV